MTTPFELVTWNAGDQVSAKKLKQMSNNDQFLLERIAKVRYNTNSIRRDVQTKILALRTPYGATPARQQRFDVYFNGFFSSGCSPIVTATVISQPQKRLIVTVAGLGGTQLPDARGCFVQVEASELYPQTDQLGGSIYNGGYVDMIAIGF